MPLLSVNVAQPHEVEIQGKVVATGIDKLPVPGRVHLAALLRHALTLDSLAPLLHRDFSARLAAIE